MVAGNTSWGGVGFFNAMIGDGSAVSVSGGGAGGAGGAFDIEDGKVVRCGLMFGRRWLTCNDTTLPALGRETVPSGVIYATVAHGGQTDPALSVAAGGSLPSSGLDVTHRLLYKAEGSGTAKFWADYRSCVTIVAMD